MEEEIWEKAPASLPLRNVTALGQARNLKLMAPEATSAPRNALGLGSFTH